MPKIFKAHILGLTPPEFGKPCTFSSQNKLKYRSILQPRLNSSQPISPWPYQQQEDSLLKQANRFRKIPALPFKVLDAPALGDDFYLNLIDWSSKNVLSVGLSSCVYLWSPKTSSVTKLCDLGLADNVTSVHWSPTDPHLAVGTKRGKIQIWDCVKMKKIRNHWGHRARVCSIAWSKSILASGSRDKNILFRDPR